MNNFHFWHFDCKKIKSYPPPASEHNHEIRIDQNGLAGGCKKAERWHQTSSTFEMSFLKKRREGEKQKQKINESNLT